MSQLEEGCYGLEQVEAWDAIKHPAMPRTAPTAKIYPVQRVNSTDDEETLFEVLGAPQ